MLYAKVIVTVISLGNLSLASPALSKDILYPFKTKILYETDREIEKSIFVKNHVDGGVLDAPEPGRFAKKRSQGRSS
jgi:hypothetical protein